MKAGCFTALVTPFIDDASRIDREGLQKLVEFQVENGITGILAVGTTGESPTLGWQEHNLVVEIVAGQVKGRCLSIAGTGSNNTSEALEATEHAVGLGVDAVLLVDPYYNGPSSLEIRREYVAPIAAAFPQVKVIPYVIPGRTGAQLLPEDLAILARQYSNVDTVKEATGDLANMKRTRQCCGADFCIFSGDDGLTFTMMTDPEIKAAGVISVISNVAPKAVSQMVAHINQGNLSEARSLKRALDPLFDLVVVKTTENCEFGDVMCRARNPLPVKTLMTLLGMPAGPCRRPLGKMTANGFQKVLDTARKVNTENPEILRPVAEFFGVDIEARLADANLHQSLIYQNY